jgi:hypothetical protein
MEREKKEPTTILLPNNSIVSLANIDFVDLKKQASKFIQENQISQSKIRELETRNSNLTTQLTEQEELLVSFQKQVIKAEETKEKYNELELNHLNHQIEMQNFKIANNIIRSYFEKEIEDLKQKLRVSRQQKTEN